MRRPWLKNVDRDKRILEIGPLAWPNIKKSDAKNVFYADIRSTECLRDFYRNDPNVPVEKIVDVDYVLEAGGGYQNLRVEKFDYVIATHVIEHVPQLILFFQDISRILNPKGKLCLAIPDKRYCFDHFRSTTSFAECYDVYTSGTSNLPFRVMDFHMNATINRNRYWWMNAGSFEYLPNDKEQSRQAKEAYFRALDGEYIDVHFSVFTPETFLLFLYHMIEFGLLPFRCSEFHKTEIGALEFNCVLELEPRALVADSVENKEEKKRIVELLGKNADKQPTLFDSAIAMVYEVLIPLFHVARERYLRWHQDISR